MYNSSSSVRTKEETCIRLTQENLIEFLVQYIYLIYARLIVYTTQILVYPKDYIYHILLTYSIMLFF